MGSQNLRQSAERSAARQVTVRVVDLLQSVQVQEQESKWAPRARAPFDFRIERVENGHTVPAVDTLEKMARALEVPMYRLFTDEEHVKKPNIPAEAIRSRAVRSKEDNELRAFAKFLSRMDDKDRGLMFRMGSKMAGRA